MLEYEIFGELVYLLPQGCMFLPANNMLMLADLHLGKATHFRQAGLAVPSALPKQDLKRLSEAMLLVPGVQQVCFLGDVFHSQYNQEWPLLEAWMAQYAQVQFSMVWGNHDRHAAAMLPPALIAFEQRQVGPFMLSHEPLADTKGYYNLCGHVHPAVVLEGPGRQRLKLPCFYLKASQGILPAFGQFNGHATLPLQQAKAVFALAENKIWKL
jgi:DNA ligase-associated metallophosphoesterase